MTLALEEIMSMEKIFEMSYTSNHFCVSTASSCLWIIDKTGKSWKIENVRRFAVDTSCVYVLRERKSVVCYTLDGVLLKEVSSSNADRFDEICCDDNTLLYITNTLSAQCLVFDKTTLQLLRKFNIAESIDTICVVKDKFFGAHFDDDCVTIIDQTTNERKILAFSKKISFRHKYFCWAGDLVFLSSETGIMVIDITTGTKHSDIQGSFGAICVIPEDGFLLAVENKTNTIQCWPVLRNKIGEGHLQQTTNVENKQVEM
jgi:hypothetical protein